MNRSVLYLLFFTLLVSCRVEENQAVENESTTINPPFIFNLSNFFSDAERELNFPLWFSDSVIKSRKIKGIIRKVFDDEPLDSIEEYNLLPVRQYTYSFDVEGYLSEMIVEHFYDNKRIGYAHFAFKPDVKAGEYSEVKVLESDDLETVNTYYSMYDIVNTSLDWSCYQNEETKDLLYVVHNAELRKPLTIDSLFHPDANDVIVWGSLEFPIKKYQVKNLVEERSTKEYIYFGNLVSKLNWDDEPFKFQRTTITDKKGKCVGFVDSTFSLSHFINAVHHNFEFENELPVRLEHTNDQLSKAKKRLYFEDFIYSYYDEE